MSTCRLGKGYKLLISEHFSLPSSPRLRGDPEAAFENWRKRLPKCKPKPPVPGLLLLPPVPTTTAAATGKPASKESKKEVVVKKPVQIVVVPPKNKPELRKNYLAQKYGRRWVEKLYKIDSSECIKFDSKELTWLKKLLFCPGSVQTRTFSAGLLKDLSQIPERRLKVNV